ncbi:uncharacterized protein LACBIDRAFT_308104 [Laccaria bicolor S238N-H82]|uniref:Predicted protein n=1 Tax=Laccaria bicolor (strain S238N-H82 / ATCC MYA-4686) TaxID=486041 RepID=B0DRN3_LACBS|nr:uncharacterized protein LACBIDRAFT_308104 [Laccaria bicolor S238N-H82]EDR02815.1 predicted protein [Laccaria bicolor S238N-H82]|eukprot:XP_001886525.1 predicted protein [Laccaria bicolor S238N-H82]
MPRNCECTGRCTVFSYSHPFSPCLGPTSSPHFILSGRHRSSQLNQRHLDIRPHSGTPPSCVESFSDERRSHGDPLLLTYQGSGSHCCQESTVLSVSLHCGFLRRQNPGPSPWLDVIPTIFPLRRPSIYPNTSSVVRHPVRARWIVNPLIFDVRPQYSSFEGLMNHPLLSD